jgi:hypothetical protein
LPKDLLERDLVQRSCQETSDTDLVRRPGEENADLVQRSFLASLNKDLALRSLKEIFCGDLLYRHLVQKALQRDFAQQLYREPVKKIVLAIFYRDLRKGNLQNPTWHPFFQRPP